MLWQRRVPRSRNGQIAYIVKRYLVKGCKQTGIVINADAPSVKAFTELFGAMAFVFLAIN